MHGVEPSSLGGGWGYRGYEGLHFRLQVDFPCGPSAVSCSQPSALPTPTVGWGGGAGAFFSRYQDMELYFFYPSLYLFPWIEIPLGNPRWGARYSLPVEWYLRKEVEIAFSLGISVGVTYRWKSSKAGVSP